MENPTNVQVIAKKIWNVVGVMVFMSRRGSWKRKLMFDLNMLMKLAKKKIKINGNGHHNNASHHRASDFRFFPCAHAPQTMDGDDDVYIANAVHKVFDMINNEASLPAVYGFLKSPMVREMVCSELWSPALFGRTPTVRQLRVTDSPFPLGDVEVDSHVDKAAEEFISRFYDNLRKQN